MINIFKKNKVFLVVFVLLILSTFVSASYYEYNIQNNIDDQTDNEKLGDIVITKTNLVSEDYGISDIMPLDIEKNDRVFWQGNGTVEVYNNQGMITTLNQGEYFVFSDVNENYHLKKNNDSSSVNVNSIPEFNGKLNIKSELDFEYDKKKYDISSSKFYNIKIQNYSKLRGNYSYEITFEYNRNQKNISDSINILKIEDWKIVSENIKNVTKVKAGDFVNIGLIEIQNEGNDNFDLNIETQGEIENYLNIPDTVSMFNNQNSYVNVMAQVPSQEEDKVVSGLIKISNNDAIETINLSIEIADLIKPEIKNISFDHNNVIKDNFITVKAFDNVDVERCTVEYQDNNETKIFNLTKDQQNFYHNCSFNDRNINLTFCAYDKSDNYVCKNITKNLELLDPLEYKNKIEGLTVKKDKWNKIHIMNITENVYDGVNISIDKFYLDNNMTDYDIRLIDENDEKTEIDNINDTININEGKLYLEIRGDVKGSWELDFSINTSKHIVNYTNFIVNGNIAEYNTPEKYETKVGNRKISCEPDDNGFIQESKYVCTTEMPITTDLKNSLLFITTKEKDMLDEEIEKLKSDKIGLHGMYISIIGILIVVVLFVVVLSWLYVQVLPSYVWVKQKKD